MRGLDLKVPLTIFALILVVALPLPAHAQLETNPTPMWEGVEKSPLDIENDKKFVNDALALTNGDRRAAVVAILTRGWDLIGEGQTNEAIRSFNQAWLIEPEFSDIHWAFAIATHIRGDPLEKVERHFDRAKKGREKDPRLAADRGRVLDERKMPEKAKVWFKHSIDLDASYLPAYVGMIQVARKLGDTELEAEYQEKHDELTGKTQ